MSAPTSHYRVQDDVYNLFQLLAAADDMIHGQPFDDVPTDTLRQIASMTRLARTTADNAQRDIAALASVEQSDPDLTPLSHFDLRALHEALRAVQYVIDGLATGPQFSEERQFTAAGKILDGLSARIGCMGDDVAQQARKLVPANSESRLERIHLLLQDEAKFLECGDIDAAERALALIDRGGL